MTQIMPSSPSIFYALLTTEKYKTRQRILLNSWLGRVSSRSFIFFSDGFDASTNSIITSTRTDYTGAEEKFINGCRILGSLELDFDYIFFGDDDTYLSVPNLTALLSTNPGGVALGSIIESRTSPENPIFIVTGPDLRYFSGGAGFVISRSIVKYLKYFRNFNRGYGDVSFGENLRELGIIINNHDGFHSQHYNHYPHSPNPSDISYHYIRSIEDCDYLSGMIG